MANIKSQKKRNRQNERRRERNKGIRTEIKTEIKKVRMAAASGDVETANAAYQQAARAIDKAVSKGVVHKRTASRRKSRLARAIAAGQ